MTKEEITTKLSDIVARITHAPKENIKPETTWEELKADSLDIVQMLVAIEEDFGIEIPDEDAKKLTSFGEMINYVSSKTAK